MSKIICCLGVLIVFMQSASAQTVNHRVPNETWLAYAKPSEAGFSKDGLAAAKKYWESTPSAAFMVVRDGAVVVAWGDVERRYMLHSVRKSFMNGLYGIHVKANRIDLNKTLAQLGIDDVKPTLNDQEKAATVLNLLQSRSGVYHNAAAEPRGNPKPKRGRFAPGDHWCYNNWDFNTLATILEQVLDGTMFEEFQDKFAKPLGMQDFRTLDGHYEKSSKSLHPAYVMRLSARDMARFGLLYLNGGTWGNQQIFTEDWVRESTREHSPNAGSESYGLLWWIMETEPFKKHGMYSGLGIGEQSLDVLPKSNLVMVHRVNTYARKNVSRGQRLKLVEMILEAMNGDVVKTPSLLPLASVGRSYKPRKLSLKRKRELCGPIEIPAMRASCEIKISGDDLILEGPMGNFGLIATGSNNFILEDAEFKFRLEEDEDGKNRRLVMSR